MHQVFEFLSSWTRYIYGSVVTQPLRTLYMEGPALQGYGFWGGRDVGSICSQISSLQASFFEGEENMEACSTMIQKNFNSFYIAIVSCMYFYYVLLLLHCVSRVLLNAVRYKVRRRRRRNPKKRRTGVGVPHDRDRDKIFAG
jgi:hypothetical protein